MFREYFNNSLDLDTGTQAAYFPVFNESGRCSVAILVMCGELCEREARRVERLFAPFLDLAEQFFDYLSGVGSAKGFSLHVAPLSEFIGEGDAGEYLALELEDRSGARSAHFFHKKSHYRGAADATICNRVKQECGRGFRVNHGFICNGSAGRVEGQPRAARRWHTLLTSGSQVRVLLGSIHFPPNFHKSTTQSGLKTSRRSV